MRYFGSDRGPQVVDEGTMRGLLARFHGGELKTMLGLQHEAEVQRANEAEEELAKLSEKTLAAIVEERPARRGRRIRGEEDVVERADALKRRIRNCRGRAHALDVFIAHVKESTVYYLTMGEVSGLTGFEEDDE